LKTSVGSAVFNGGLPISYFIDYGFWLAPVMCIFQLRFHVVTMLHVWEPIEIDDSRTGAIIISQNWGALEKMQRNDVLIPQKKRLTSIVNDSAENLVLSDIPYFCCDVERVSTLQS
jgi:hypothetical protein